jgi:hypothetical protein
MEVVGDWNVRGGIKTVVTVRYEAPPAAAGPRRSPVRPRPARPARRG